MIEKENQSLIDILVKYREDLLFDEFMEIFEKVPAQIKTQVYQHYETALKSVSEKLNTSLEILREEIENKAVEKINGSAFGPQHVKERLKEYGLEINS